jgi:hypothetical protein
VDTGFDDPTTSNFLSEREGFHGVEAFVKGNISRYVGLKGSYSFNRKSFEINGGTAATTFDVDTDLHQFLGGVEFKDNAKETKVKPFAHVMAGVAHARADVSTATTSFDESETGFAAVVGGGAVEVKKATTAPPRHAAPRVAVHRLPAVPALRPIPVQHVADRTAGPQLATRVSHDATIPAAAAQPAEPTVADVQPASDSPVVDQSNGGMLAPEEADDTVTSATDDASTSTGTQTGTATTTGTATGTATTTTPGAQSGPDGGATGASPPSAQGATAPGTTKTPS